MCKRFVYLFLVFGFCVVTARGELTLAPLSTWDITDDFGDILSLNDYPVSSLITGTSEFANPPGQSGNELAPAADDFTLYTAACVDGQDWMRTVFDQPVSIIFILEKNGNDSGTIQALDANGNPSGNAITFTGGSSYWTNTGYLASFMSTQQNTFGAMLTSDIPIYGILITAPGIDPVSILEFGQTYFWRIDEVNAPPDLTIYKGKVWSFTVEPFAYPIPAENITPTASSSMQGNEPDKTIDGSGLDENNPDLHSIDTKSMWVSDIKSSSGRKLMAHSSGLSSQAEDVASIPGLYLVV